MSRAAKFTLGVSVLGSALVIWGVHFMQQQEREVCPLRHTDLNEASQLHEDHVPRRAP